MNQSQEEPLPFSASQSHLLIHKPISMEAEFNPLVGKTKMFMDLETDQESGASSEDMDNSPKSVAKVRRGYVHNQILRIREEESHIGEDVVEGLGANNPKNYRRFLASPVSVVLFSKHTILPSSPLSGKTPSVNAATN